MTDAGGSRLRALPSVDRLLAVQAAQGWMASFPREAVVEALRAVLADARKRLMSADCVDVPADLEAQLLQAAAQLLQARFRSTLRSLVNATGVVLHTNLGRAPLCDAAVQALTETSAHYMNLEFDLETGKRGRRGAGLLELICDLTGAEAACVVNNNAAAVLLMLDTLAKGREVVVSRSELIEIGGSFRLPDVLTRSGATLVEVGTTNKTWLRDYERAITSNTGLLLKSHTSNFRIIGFTHEVTAAELAELGHREKIPTALDLGSGVLVDLAAWNLPAEPTVQACVRAGLDLVCFSGDKLLGGPQAGILVGRKDMIRRCTTNPLMRALRCDRLTLVALEATLGLYRDPRRLPGAVPVLAMLARSAEELQATANQLASALALALGADATVDCRSGASLPGGGSLPGHQIPTWLVRVLPTSGRPAEWAARLRQQDPPVVVRTEENRLVLDPRTLRPGDEVLLIDAFKGVAGTTG